MVHQIDGEQFVLDVLLIDIFARIVNVCDCRVQLVQVVVEACGLVVALFVLVGHSGLYLVAVAEFIVAHEVCHPFVFVQRSEVSHRLLLHFEHHLASVRFGTRCLAVRAAPVDAPCVLYVVLAAELVVLQAVDVRHAVAAYQIVVFVIHTFAAHVCVRGVAGVEESIAQQILLSERVAYAGK